MVGWGFWPLPLQAQGHKSLLLLFFRKEESSLFLRVLGECPFYRAGLGKGVGL